MHSIFYSLDEHTVTTTLQSKSSSPILVAD
jgi:hypothetical protein